MSEIVTARQGGRISRAAQAVFHEYAAVLATPWSDVMVGISVQGDVVTSVDFLGGSASPLSGRAAIAREAVRQLQAYFQDHRFRFALPLAPAGTAFQRRVWDALRRIPAGETRSYGELAHQLGSGPRAIGAACRANPIPLFIPCHRIVAAHGLGGFMGVTMGRGLHLKQRLLDHERPT